MFGLFAFLFVAMVGVLMCLGWVSGVYVLICGLCKRFIVNLWWTQLFTSFHVDFGLLLGAFPTVLDFVLFICLVVVLISGILCFCVFILCRGCCFTCFVAAIGLDFIFVALVVCLVVVVWLFVCSWYLFLITVMLIKVCFVFCGVCWFGLSGGLAVLICLVTWFWLLQFAYCFVLGLLFDYVFN